MAAGYYKKGSEVKLEFTESTEIDAQYISSRDGAKVARENEVNDLISIMKDPLEKEQVNKIKYRSIILIAYLIFFLAVTVSILWIILSFRQKGFSNNETSIIKYLVAGLFVNMISLAVVIFKYLFDDKNSLMKDMIKLMIETLKETNSEK